MAATALEIVSLAEIKQHLRLRESNTGQDVLLTDLINGAVDAVERETGLTLVDKSAHTECFIPDYADTSVTLFADGVRMRDSEGAATDTVSTTVKYTDAQHVRASAECALTRLGVRRAIIHPPEDNGGVWPIRAEENGEETELSVVLELDGPTDIPPSLKNAVILVARFIYDHGASVNIPERGAIATLLGQHRREVYA